MRSVATGALASDDHCGRWLFAPNLLIIADWPRRVAPPAVTGPELLSYSPKGLARLGTGGTVNADALRLPFWDSLSELSFASLLRT